MGLQSLKNALWLVGGTILLVVLMVALANGFSGTGMIVAMKANDFTIRYFGGSTAGRDSAYTYATPNGLVSMGPGTEGLGLGTIPAGVTVVRQSYTGWEQAGRPLRVSPLGTNRFLVDSTGTTTTGKHTVTDSLRINKVAKFDLGVNINGASWIHGKMVSDDSLAGRWLRSSLSATQYLTVFPNGITFGGNGNSGALTINNGNTFSTSGIDFFTSNSQAGTIHGGTLFAPRWWEVMGNLTASDSIRADKGIQVGGQFIPKILRNSASLDFDLSAVNCQDLTITVTGAATGDDVVLGVPSGVMTTDEQVVAWVSSANTVTVRACDYAAAGNPASGTYSVTVIKR
jgi:hypothetical protein